MIPTIHVLWLYFATFLVLIHTYAITVGTWSIAWEAKECFSDKDSLGAIHWRSFLFFVDPSKESQPNGTA